MYLCDTGIIQDKHRNILKDALQEVINLIIGPLVITPKILGMSTVKTDDTTDNYNDAMG